MHVVVVIVGLLLLIGALFWAWPLALGAGLLSALHARMATDPDGATRKSFAPVVGAIAVVSIAMMFWWVPVASDMSSGEPEPEPVADDASTVGYLDDFESDRDADEPSDDVGDYVEDYEVGDYADVCSKASAQSNMTADECMEAFGF